MPLFHRDIWFVVSVLRQTILDGQYGMPAKISSLFKKENLVGLVDCLQRGEKKCFMSLISQSFIPFAMLCLDHEAIYVK